jgi:DNA-binding response OmpR family regulator
MSSVKGLKGCRVLIVEDEYFLASDLEKALEEHGAIVLGPIGNLAEALPQAEHDGFDVAILDINLHDEAAYPIADELMRQGIPFAFYTGYGAKVIPERFANVMLLQKPFVMLGLVEHIALLCQRGSMAE